MTTAAGIVVAVIATICFNLFVRKIRTRTAQLEDAREGYLALWSQFQKRARSTGGTQTTTGRKNVKSKQQEPVAVLSS